MDLDNFVKALMDGCKLFFDDSQVVWSIQALWKGRDKEGIYLKIYDAEGDTYENLEVWHEDKD